MAERAFQNYASSGELLELYIGGIQPEHKILTSVGVANAIAAPKDSVSLTPQSSPPTAVEGLSFYDDDSHSISYYTDIAGVTINVGQEMVRRVINLTGSDIIDGSPVKQGGVDATSGRVKAILAIANSFTNARILGIATHTILDGQEGFISFGGEVHGLDIETLSDGTTTLVTGLPVYLSSTVAGKYTMTPPDIATQIGGFLTGTYGLTNGTMTIKTEENINLPTVIAYMNDGAITGTILNGTYLDIANYTSHGNVVMPYNATTGEITIYADGVYSLTINDSMLFDAIGNSEETVSIRLNSSIAANYDIPVTIPRNSAAASAFPKISFSATEGEVLKLQIACTTTTLTNVSFPLMSFEIESKQIR